MATMPTTTVLDYLSDFICVLYGAPSAYGVVTMPFSVREGINIFLAGFVPTENLRFREASDFIFWMVWGGGFPRKGMVQFHSVLSLEEAQSVAE